MYFIPISWKASSTGTPTVAIKVNNIYGSQSPCMLYVISWFVGPPIELTGGIFTTRTRLSASIPSFVNSTTGRRSAIYFTNSECAAKDTSFDKFSTPLSLHDCVDLLCHKKCLTPTSSLLAGTILIIGTSKFGLPPVYHMNYIRLWFEAFLCSTAIGYHSELWPPQVISKFSHCLSYCSSFS